MFEVSDEVCFSCIDMMLLVVVIVVFVEDIQVIVFQFDLVYQFYIVDIGGVELMLYGGL